MRNVREVVCTAADDERVVVVDVEDDDGLWRAKDSHRQVWEPR